MPSGVVHRIRFYALATSRSGRTRRPSGLSLYYLRRGAAAKSAPSASTVPLREVMLVSRSPRITTKEIAAVAISRMAGARSLPLCRIV